MHLPEGRLRADAAFPKRGGITCNRVPFPDLWTSQRSSTFRATPAAWTHWQAMPTLYRAVRLGYVEEVRRQPLEFGRRLANLVRNTEKNVQFGNWNDGGRLTEPEP